MRGKREHGRRRKKLVEAERQLDESNRRSQQALRTTVPGPKPKQTDVSGKQLREKRAGVIKSSDDEAKRRRLGVHGKKSQQR